MLEIPYTELRGQFAALQGRPAEEQLRMAQTARGSVIGSAFADSVAQFSPYRNLEPFYGNARPALLPGDGSRTEHLASLLERAGSAEVPAAPALRFRYVDREIVPARTTSAAVYSNGQKKTQFVRFDLLLAGDLPILAEVKIANDATAFYALAQLLTAAAEMATPHQRERLRLQYGSRLPLPGDERVDLYLIFDRFPTNSPVKCQILQETRRIAEEFVQCVRVRPYIRRLAAIHYEPDPCAVRFRPEFVCAT